jgi:hypothetical protein
MRSDLSWTEKVMTEDEFAMQNWENEGGAFDLGEPAESDSNTEGTREETPQTSAGRG